jgi:ribokinase
MLCRGGANSIVVSPGANADLDAETALSQLHDLTADDFLLAQLETPLETVEAAFAYAARIGATTILDPAPARKLPPSLIANASLITPNQIEAGVLDLAAMGARMVLKLGAMGSLYSGLRVAAFPVAAVDTTAAGDVFNGALSVALAEGRPMGEAMRFANAAAAVSVTRRGAQNSAPDRADVERMLAGQWV